MEHVDDPVTLMARVKTWLAPNGKLFLGVPNGNPVHRLVAVKMGLLNNPCQLNALDHALRHRRVFTPATFRAAIEQSGLKVLEMRGGGRVYFKLLSNWQIQENRNEELIQGFFELGKNFPEFTAKIYTVCQCSRV